MNTNFNFSSRVLATISSFKAFGRGQIVFLTYFLHFSWTHVLADSQSSVNKVVYKSRQPAKFAGFSARFCRLLSLLQETRYGKEMMFIRSKLRLNKNINLHRLSFLKKYKRFLTQGQFTNVMFETVAGKYIQYNLLSTTLDFEIWMHN